MGVLPSLGRGWPAAFSLRIAVTCNKAQWHAKVNGFRCKERVDAIKAPEKEKSIVAMLSGTLMGNRTPDSAVRGRRLNRLTMRAFCVFAFRLCDNSIKARCLQANFPLFSKLVDFPSFAFVCACYADGTPCDVRIARDCVHFFARSVLNCARKHVRIIKNFFGGSYDFFQSFRTEQSHNRRGAFRRIVRRDADHGKPLRP